MTTVWCFYHGADLDGHCSAAIVRKWCDREGYDLVFRPVNYGREVDWLEGAGGRSLAVVVDFTPEGDDPASMLAAMKHEYEGGLIWIDHHKSAIGKVGERGSEFDGRRRENVAACRLAWAYFFGGVVEPKAVELLGRYDVFDRSHEAVWEDYILPFQYGLRAYDTDPAADAFDWDGLLDPNGESYVGYLQDGRACLRYQRRENEKLARGAAYDCVFEGLLCCAVNGRGNSLVLDAYARPEHRMRILWRFDGGLWRVSLYENGHEGVDCSEIAARWGGGGHKGAAGFTVAADRAAPLPMFLPVKGGV